MNEIKKRVVMYSHEDKNHSSTEAASANFTRLSYSIIDSSCE